MIKDYCYNHWYIITISNPDVRLLEMACMGLNSSTVNNVFKSQVVAFTQKIKKTKVFFFSAVLSLTPWFMIRQVVSLCFFLFIKKIIFKHRVDILNLILLPTMSPKRIISTDWHERKKRNGKQVCWLGAMIRCDEEITRIKWCLQNISPRCSPAPSSVLQQHLFIVTPDGTAKCLIITQCRTQTMFLLVYVCVCVILNLCVY